MNETERLTSQTAYAPSPSACGGESGGLVVFGPHGPW